MVKLAESRTFPANEACFSSVSFVGVAHAGFVIHYRAVTTAIRLRKSERTVAIAALDTLVRQRGLFPKRERGTDPIIAMDSREASGDVVCKVPTKFGASLCRFRIFFPHQPPDGFMFSVLRAESLIYDAHRCWHTYVSSIIQFAFRHRDGTSERLEARVIGMSVWISSRRISRAFLSSL